MKKLAVGALACAFVLLSIVAFKAGHTSAKRNTQQDTAALNVVYGSNINYLGKQQVLTMDIYYPSKRVEGKVYPMVMMIHGGSFLNGNKEAMTGHCKQLADSGFVAVTINYRKGWDANSIAKGCEGVDAQGIINANYRAAQDAHAAMRYLVANANKYHIDTKWLFIGGSSAGAITALDIVYLDQKYADGQLPASVAALGKVDTASNKLTNKFKIAGICGMWGALPDSTLVNKKTAVPTIYFHGTADMTVPYNRGFYVPNCTRVPEMFGSACLYRQNVAAGVPAVLVTSVGGKHGPVEHTRALVISNTACFFHRVMAGKAKSASYGDAVAGCR